MLRPIPEHRYAGKVSPAIVRAIADGSAPADLTVSTLARALPHDWAEQERHLLRLA